MALEWKNANLHPRCGTSCVQPDSDTDFKGVCESLRCVKELITAVDSKVNDQEKKRRLREIYT